MPPLTASVVMNRAAVLLNDSARSLYTYGIQMPYLNMALQDLRKDLQLNNSPVTNFTSTALTVPAGTISIPFNAVSGPVLPAGLIEIQQLWESVNGVSDNWIPMTRVDFLPLYMEGIESNQWLVWAWESNSIKLLPAIAINYMKIQYIRNLFTDVSNPSDPIEVIDSDSYLEFKTAEYLARYIAENPTRADVLRVDAQEALDKMLGIDNKGRQAIMTRRLPFRSGWKNRGVW